MSHKQNGTVFIRTNPRAKLNPLPTPENHLRPREIMTEVQRNIAQAFAIPLEMLSQEYIDKHVGFLARIGAHRPPRDLLQLSELRPNGTALYVAQGAQYETRVVAPAPRDLTTRY